MSTLTEHMYTSAVRAECFLENSHRCGLGRWGGGASAGTLSEMGPAVSRILSTMRDEEHCTLFAQSPGQGALIELPRTLSHLNCSPYKGFLGYGSRFQPLVWAVRDALDRPWTQVWLKLHHF